MNATKVVATGIRVIHQLAGLQRWYQGGILGELACVWRVEFLMACYASDTSSCSWSPGFNNYEEEKQQQWYNYLFLYRAYCYSNVTT